jgi:hypothetical protein
MCKTLGLIPQPYRKEQREREKEGGKEGRREGRKEGRKRRYLNGIFYVLNAPFYTHGEG